jgi:hypothetical protein
MMHRFSMSAVAGLCGVLLAASTAAAQSGPVLTTESQIVPVAHHGLHGAPSCQTGPCTQTICKPVPAKITIAKTVYGCRDVDFCLPKCSHSGMFGCLTKGLGGCGAACGHSHGCCAKNPCPPVDPCPQCEEPRCRKVLLKRIVVTTCDSFTCVPEKVAVPVQPCPQPCPQACPAPCHGGHSLFGGLNLFGGHKGCCQQGAVIVEKAPKPLEKK